MFFFFSSRRRHTRCALVTGVQTCALPILAEDYSFPYTQAFGFLEPFCRLGGKAPLDARFWVPIGNKDFSSVIAALPDDVDAIYVALGGADAVNFLTQYERAGEIGRAHAELQSLMRISYAVFCLKKKTNTP